MAVKILIADDHAIVRDGLRSLLEAIGNYQVVGEAADGRETCERAKALQPDIVIIDVGMPNLNGIDATRMLVGALPEVLVIGLSMHADLDFVVAMLSAGARGYLLKESAFSEMQAAITAVQRGEFYLSRQLDSMVIQEFTRSFMRYDANSTGVLSSRERQVLQLLAEGYSNKEVASRMGIAVRSAETYRAQLMDKLNIHSIAGLTKYAVRVGITSLE